MPKGKKRQNRGPDLLKIEDPIKRLARQQRWLEEDVSAAVQGTYAKQRDVNDPTFNMQGPATESPGVFGYGTKDRMPGSTPLPQRGLLYEALKRLGIIKPSSKKKPIKTKGTGNLV